MYSIFIHTHSDYDDALVMCIGQLEKYMPNVRRYIAIEKKTKTVEKENVILYNESDSYTQRLQSILPQIEGDTVLYLHEDMILYDHPNLDELKRCEQHVLNDDVMMIGLMGSTGVESEPEFLPKIRVTPNPYKFSVQPTIWKKDKFQQLVSDENLSIWQLESNIQSKFSSIGEGYTYFDGTEKLRGRTHYDSNIFPFIATAIVQGKWNNLQYPSELESLFEHYNITSDMEMMV